MCCTVSWFRSCTSILRRSPPAVQSVCMWRETIIRLKDSSCMLIFSENRVLPCTLQNFGNHFSFCLAASHLGIRKAVTIRLFALINYYKLKMFKKTKDTFPSARGMFTNGTVLCWGTDWLLFNMPWTLPLAGKVLETVCCNPALEYNENVTLRLTSYALLAIFKHEANVSSRKYT